MGDAQAIMAAFLLAMPVAIGSTLLTFAGAVLGFFPRAVRLEIFFLIGLTAFAGLCLSEAVGALITWPTSLQKEYLGEVYAGPPQLRHYASWGFADTGNEWSYDVNPAILARLQTRCRLEDHVFAGPPRCIVGSAGQPDQWFFDASLSEGRLHLTYGVM